MTRGRSRLLSKTHHYLCRVVERLFPQSPIEIDYCPGEKMIFSRSGRPIELDIFLPNISLCFEYNGLHHYRWSSMSCSMAVNLQQRRDQEKRVLCTSNGWTIIEIPYWWNLRESSLVLTIRKHRPDLLEGRHTNELDQILRYNGGSITEYEPSGIWPFSTEKAAMVKYTAIASGEKWLALSQ